MTQIGKRKFTIILAFMGMMFLMFIAMLIFIADQVNTEVLKIFLLVLGIVVGAGIGAIGVENLAKYGFGKRTKEEVE